MHPLTGLPRRICLVTPTHLSSNPRIIKEADALSEAGCEVAVVSGDCTVWGRSHDRAFAGKSWTSVAQVRYGPEAPLSTYVMQAIRRRSARALARWAGPAPILAGLAIHPASAELVQATMAVEADLYVAHYVAALPAVAAAARTRRALYAFDAEDFHPGDLPEGKAYEFERGLSRSIEARHLPGCAYMTAASSGIADAYAETYGVPRPTVVLNVFPRDEAPREPTHDDVGRSLYWFSQTLGPGRGLEAAVEAIALARARPTLHLRGTPAEGYAGTLMAHARHLGVEDRLELLPPGPPSEMARLASGYAIGLVAELGHTQNRRIALTNKLFSFLLGGVPVVASDISAHRDLEGLGAAVTLFRENDAQSLADAIDGLLLNPDRLARARREAWELGQTRYNWDVEKAALIDAVRAGATRSGVRSR